MCSWHAFSSQEEAQPVVFPSPPVTLWLFNKKKKIPADPAGQKAVTHRCGGTNLSCVYAQYFFLCQGCAPILGMRSVLCILWAIWRNQGSLIIGSPISILLITQQIINKFKIKALRLISYRVTISRVTPKSHLQYVATVLIKFELEEVESGDREVFLDRCRP